MYVRRLKYYVARVLDKFGTSMLTFAGKLRYVESKLVQHGETRSLYSLPAGYDLWLNDTGYIDRQIITTGTFEPITTRAINRFIKQGDVVIDVGANIGYYTVLFSKLVGDDGKVIAFEPTTHFGEVLRRNIETNNLSNVEVIDFGLSNTSQSLMIDIGPSSATLHSPAGFDAVISHEKISLTTFDDFAIQTNP
jgi:FkbM family methyltransferase